MEKQELEVKANEIRKSIIRMIHAAGSGHPGGSLSSADIMTVLYFDIMNIDPKEPDKKDRDKFVLSKGHAAPVLYAALAHRGFFDISETETLRKLGSDFQGHPNMNKVPGVEMSTGSLGQGLSVSVGMALAAKLDESDATVYTLMGDGEIQEGMIWEAAMAAGHYKLDNLVGIVDWNGLQIDGRNDDVMTVTPIVKKFAAFGWEVITCDGHSMDELRWAFQEAKKIKQPAVIVAKTHKGKGVSFMEDEPGWHGKAPDQEQYEQAMKDLGGEI
jgi:transketolase